MNDRIFDRLEFLVLRQRDALFRRILISSDDRIPLRVPQIIKRSDLRILGQLVHDGVDQIAPGLRQIAVDLFALVVL